MADVYLLREDQGSTVDADEDQRSEEEEGSEEALFCRYCGHRITLRHFAVEMDGLHQHTFFNPAGILYEIRCFSRAEGCVHYGPPSMEFTWFAGHSWRLLLCSACSVHMGWSFSSAETRFYGLIARNLSTS